MTPIVATAVGTFSAGILVGFLTAVLLIVPNKPRVLEVSILLLIMFIVSSMVWKLASIN